jgi:hypothetical protein
MDNSGIKMLVLMGLMVCGAMELFLAGLILGKAGPKSNDEIFGRLIAVFGVGTMILTVAIWQIT